jgi:hypothetical protein
VGTSGAFRVDGNWFRGSWDRILKSQGFEDGSMPRVSTTT